VNYDNSLVVTITVTCYSWAPSSGDPLFTCGAIYRLHPPTFCSKIAPMIIRNLNAFKECSSSFTSIFRSYFSIERHSKKVRWTKTNLQK